MITLTIEDKQIEHIFLDEFHSNKEKFFEFIKLSFDGFQNQSVDEDLSYLEDDFDEGIASGMCEQSHDEIFDELLKKYAKN
ncbi:MAG: hypothetical protein PHO62_10540 [Sulfurimonas sp.]|uniref:hypothetical protein n=1 Tax=Sulfurimonas sp. TaxID=2022749 RepID=UPI00262AF8CE|nr:hypothetical protein [Sulfurimonas sp.]MDD5373847.1 hypothetical protein [Sulfurimonas sp.]